MFRFAFLRETYRKNMYTDKFYTELCQWHPKYKNACQLQPVWQKRNFSEIAEKENGFIRI